MSDPSGGSRFVEEGAGPPGARGHRRFGHRGGRPPWWPANEPWPPPDSRSWHRGRARFLRGIGCLFFLVLTLSGVGVTTIVRYLADRGAGGTWPSVAAVAVPLLALVAIMLAFVGLMRRVGIPAGDLVGAANRVADGEYSVRVVERGPPFLRSYTRAFNTMVERLQSQDALRRQLMADVAHELRTPLSVIQGRLEGLLDGVYPRDDERLRLVLDETRVLGRLIEDVRTLAHSESGTLTLQRESTDVSVLVGDVVRSLSALAESNGVRLESRCAADLPLMDLDPLRMREVLTNVVTNAHSPHTLGRAGRRRCTRRIREADDERLGHAAAASRPPICRTSSIGSTRARRPPGPAWAWRLPAPWCSPTAARSPPRALPAPAPASASGCKQRRGTVPNGTKFVPLGTVPLIQCAIAVLPFLSQIWSAARRLALGLALIVIASAVLLLSDRGQRTTSAAHVLRIAIVQHASTPVLDEGVRGMIDGLAERGFRDGRRSGSRPTTRRATSRPATRSPDR